MVEPDRLDRDLLAEARASLSGNCIFPSGGPTHVYHYTTIEGLVGILKDGRMWATDLSYTNDSSEYNYADRLLDDVCRSQQGDGRLAEIPLSILKSDPRKGFNVYAACFCGKADLLSQWRAYAKSGTGYAIEFARTDLERRFSGMSHVLLGKVEYDAGRQKRMLEDVVRAPALKTAMKEVRARGGVFVNHGLAEVMLRDLSFGPEDVRRLEEMAAKPEAYEALIEPLVRASLPELIKLMVCRAFLKSPTFAEEEEWRVALFLPKAAGNAEFRISHAMLVPYVSLDLRASDGQLPISRILIGPTLRPGQAKRSLDDFLRCNELGWIQVDASSVPLRV